MKKVFGQTVRDLKREVNKKVLKVPGIEQKVLDATSNEPWGPHGSLLADLAQASRNYHEYQLIMGVLWKRLSDTGKNWRHVYKALTVLEYMVGHGSERVIDEIRERAYQISTLSDFQYIDSGGRDQGSNVRKKSQSLVALVNDKERIAEVREKASANRDKYRTSAPGGMYKPSGGYGDKYDYGSRDEERSSYGREREYGYRDDDRNSRDGDRHSRDSEDRYGRDGNREDDYRGRSRSVDNFQTGSRGRSSDRERTFEDDGHSSRGSGARADDNSQDERGQLQRKFSEQNIGAPPSYEEAVSDSKSPVYSERDGGETPQVAAPGVASPPPPQTASPGAASPPPPQVAAPGAASPPAGSNTNNNSAAFANESSPQKFEAFDEFDPRGAFSAGPPAYASADGVSAPPAVASTSAPPTSNSVEMDLLGSLADVFSSNALAIVPADSTSVETNGQPNAPSFSTSQPSTQTFDDPFGDSPFKAFTSTDTDSNPQQSFGAPFQATPPAFTSEASHTDSAQNFGFGDSFSAVANPEPAVQNVQPPSNPQDFPQDQFDTSQSDIDILAGILPPSGPPPSLPQQPGASGPTSQFPPSGNNMYEGYHPQPVSSAPNMPGQTPFGQAGPPASLPQQPGASVATSQFPPSGNNMYEGYHPQPVSSAPNMHGQTPFGQQYNMVPPHSQNMGGATPYNSGGFMHQPGSASYNPGAVTSHPTNESFLPRPVAATSSSSQTPYTNPSGPAGQFMGHQGHGMPPSHGLQRTQSVPVNMQGNHNFMGDMFSQGGPTGSLTSSSSHQDLTPLTGAIEIVPQPQKKFEPKSSVWADTLSRGLVNFNISGPKTNPLADIGVDFEAINRREKRLEKPTNAPAPTSTINMGKAMGSGTGLGRAGANSMRPPPNPMVASGMPMGGGMNIGGYGGMNQNQQPMGGMGMGPGMNQNQPMGGMGMGPGMNMNQNQPMGMGMGPGMNMGGGYGQGYQMQPQHQGMVPGQNMPGNNNNNYNPMMGQGGYNPQQQQYGGGYSRLAEWRVLTAFDLTVRLLSLILLRLAKSCLRSFSFKSEKLLLGLIRSKGSVMEAILEAKTQKKLFVVYISGEDEEESDKLNKLTWTDASVAQSLSKYCVLLHLQAASVDATNFSAISAIGFSGTQVWKNEGFIAAEDLASSLEKAWLGLHIQETTASIFSAALASQNSEQPTSSASNVVLPSEEGSTSDTMAASQSTGTSVQPSERKSTVTSASTKEKNDGTAAIKVKQSAEPSNQPASSVQAEKEPIRPAAPRPDDSSTSKSSTDRKRKQETVINKDERDINLPKSVATEEIVKAKEEGGEDGESWKPPSDVHLNIRLPDGANLQEKFSVTSTLRMVKDYVNSNQTTTELGAAYDLAVPYPRKVYSDQDLDKSLSELGLLGRQALVVVPRKRATVYQRGPSYSEPNNNTDTNSGGYFGYLRRVLSYANPFSYFGGASSSAPEPRGSMEYMPVASNAEVRSTPAQAGSEGRGNVRNRRPTTSRIGSNIHTLRHDEEDAPFGDGNAFWNGNSTQYGGESGGGDSNDRR
uniref:UBX domain-containing protein n=1 Tax=Brassica campestris TaxID=3711 RepID=M4F9G7_BRACM